MKRPVTSARFPSISAGRPQGYTLVEILVATALTLIMVAAVVQIFGSIGESVGDTRATLEMSDRLRSTRTRLEMDLGAVTATMLPPLRPETAEGYFEYTEGPVGPVFAPRTVATNVDDPSSAVEDTTVGDFDDVLMFTTRSTGRPFVGRCAVTGGTIESDVAEVVWFVRGRTLYRRVMLVAPGTFSLIDTNSNGVIDSGDWPGTDSFFNLYDVSVRPVTGGLVPNTLGDLTKRECRYAHDTSRFPFDARVWGQLGLPTLRECSASWPITPISKTAPQIDFWNDPHPWDGVDKVTGTLLAHMGPRVAEDVILTDVIGFDVKVWDPGAPVRSDGTVALGPSDPGYGTLSGASVVSYGAYVDLGYEDVVYNPAYVPPPGVPAKRFYHIGHPGSGLSATTALPARVYDTWSFHYEHDGINQDGDATTDEGTNGFDDDGNGIVDDAGEMETSPPYPVPLRAIQVKIRVYEPDSRQIREVTVVQEFLPK